MISFVYFDVGGVVMQDFSGTNKWQELIHDLHIPKDKIKPLNQLMKVYREKASVGYMTLDEEIQGFKETLHISVPKDYSFLDDFVNRFEQNTSIWPVIHMIHKTHRVGLLTNMYIGMLDKIMERGLLPPESWDTIVDSSVVHLKKPDPKIFALAEQQAGVPHNEMFFVDNLEENILAAKEFGWQTFLYDSNNPEISSQQLLKIFS